MRFLTLIFVSACLAAEQAAINWPEIEEIANFQVFRGGANTFKEVDNFIYKFDHQKPDEGVNHILEACGGGDAGSRCKGLIRAAYGADRAKLVSIFRSAYDRKRNGRTEEKSTGKPWCVAVYSERATPGLPQPQRNILYPREVIRAQNKAEADQQGVAITKRRGGNGYIVNEGVCK